MAEEGFLGAFARMAGNFVSGSPDGPRHAWNAIAPWIGDLTRSATSLWLPHLVHGIPCEVVFRDGKHPRGVRCAGAAAAACSVCRKPCCLNHAFASCAGQVICFACVSAAAGGHVAAPASPKGAPPPPPPSAEDADFELNAKIDEAFAVLGVTRAAAWPEIDAAYKALLRRHHPDRNPRTRKRSEARFVRVRVAYDLLTANKDRLR